MTDKSNRIQCHLTYSDRCFIEQALVANGSFSSIASFLLKDPSTISKEVKRARTNSKYSHTTDEETCSVQHCDEKHLCGDENCRKLCRSCKLFKCSNFCSYYVSSHCSRLDKPPYVCNGCASKGYCHKRKFYYKAADAQKQYETTLTQSRSGINLSEEELRSLNELVSPLIRNGQPLSHIFAVHAEDIPCSQRTLYNYIDQGILDARNIDLPRRVRFKKRKRRSNSARQNEQLYRSKRSYKDFQKYTEAFPELEVVELDTVKGSREAGKCLMTLLFRRSNFMLIFLLDHCTQECVTDCFNRLYETLGHRLFRKTFPIILTDNGPEFKDPWGIEKAPDGKQRTKVFYCDPYLSNQKGKLEKNHEFIRYVIPKGRSMHFLTQEKATLLANHINSLSRESLNGAAPIDLAILLLDKRIPALLGLHKVSPDHVLLKPILLK